jgi:hypothetical protein
MMMLENFVKAKKGVNILKIWQIILIVLIGGVSSQLVAKFVEFDSVWVWIGRIGFFLAFLLIQIRCNTLNYASTKHKILFGLGIFFYMFFCSTKILG